VEQRGGIIQVEHYTFFVGGHFGDFGGVRPNDRARAFVWRRNEQLGEQ
jgi:hypothetical protein